MKQLLLLVSLPGLALADATIEYDVTFDNAVHHEARITVTVRAAGDQPIEFRMSRSSPGRYAIHEFGKNVYSVSAVDSEGNPLEIVRPNPYQWDVSGHDGTVALTYTLFADRAGGTYSGIDASHAHLNMPATFMWARNFEDRPIEIRFEPFDDAWKVATQLVPTDDAYVFIAPDLQYFLDSPTELSDHSLRSWVIEQDGKDYEIRLAVHHEGSEEDVDTFLEMAKNVVDAQIEVFGELPDFDYGTYTFIADYLPWVSGDGMEHRNSTILTSTQSFVEADFGQLGTLSHEFIHVWNVERIRPASLEPFDFKRANMSPDLWFAEGFTSYYGELTIHRAGESTLDDFADTLSYWINTVTNAPGRRYFAPQGMSRRAPFVDAATAIDPVNFSNTFVSYYTYGAALAVALDLAIRARFDDINLDSLMRWMWQTHGKTEDPYTIESIRRGLAEVTGDERFANDFFDRYIEDSQLPDYATLLENAGLALQAPNANDAWAGPVNLNVDGRDVFVSGNTIVGTPLYEAGVDRGDQILRVGRLRISSESRWASALRRSDPGDVVTIQYLQRGTDRTAELQLQSDPTVAVVPMESSDTPLTSSQRRFRASWLGEN